MFTMSTCVQTELIVFKVSFFYSAQQWMYYKSTPSFITTNQKSLTIYRQDCYYLVPFMMSPFEILLGWFSPSVSV